MHQPDPADLHAVRVALACEPQAAARVLDQLQFDRLRDARCRATLADTPCAIPGAGDFIDFTREENPNVND